MRDHCALAGADRRAGVAILRAFSTSCVASRAILFTFQGVLYPFTLAGIALLKVRAGSSIRANRASAAIAVLVVGAIALRVPQVWATADRYVFSQDSPRMIVRQSDFAAIREQVGDDAVDVAVGLYADNHAALSELAAQGTDVKIRSPAWDRSLKNWARVANSSESDLFAEKSRYSLIERNAYAPPGTERFIGGRLKLIEDREAVTILGILNTQEMTWDKNWKPGIWIGNDPITFLIHNGTGRAQAVRFRANTRQLANATRPEHWTLHYQLETQAGALVLPGENLAVLMLNLAPGLNHLALSVVRPSQPPLAQTPQPMPLLEFGNWSFEDH